MHLSAGHGRPVPDMPLLAREEGPARGAVPRCKRTPAAAEVAGADAAGGLTMPTTTARVLTAMLRIVVVLLPFAAGASVAVVLRVMGA